MRTSEPKAALCLRETGARRRPCAWLSPMMILTNKVSHINELFFHQLQQKLSTYFIIRKQAVLLQHIIPEWDLDPKPPNPETVPFPTELSA